MGNTYSLVFTDEPNSLVFTCIHLYSLVFICIPYSAVVQIHVLIREYMNTNTYCPCRGPTSWPRWLNYLARSGPSTGLDLVRKRPHLKTNIGPRHYRDPCKYYGESFLHSTKKALRKRTLRADQDEALLEMSVPTVSSSSTL